MKIRTDFVTNSSSSSFILAFRDKQDGCEKIVSLMQRYGSEYIIELLKDFDRTDPISVDDLQKKIDEDLENEACCDIMYGKGSWWSSRKDTFEKRWRDAHPGSDYGDFFQSEEYKAELTRLKEKYYKELLEKIGENQYLVMLEYEDHTPVGSELEHEILPECDFVVADFNHH